MLTVRQRADAGALQGDVKLTRRRSTAESYESRDPQDPKMASLRSSAFPFRSSIQAASVPEEEPLSLEQRKLAFEQRKIRMQERFQARTLFVSACG